MIRESILSLVAGALWRAGETPCRRLVSRAGARLRGWSRWLTDQPDLVPFCRSATLSGAVLAAFLLRDTLDIQRPALLVLATALAVNFGLLWVSLAHGRGGLRTLSSLAGIVMWGALMHVTGGLSSPFVMGLWLEIMVAAVAFPSRRALAVTFLAVAVLWVQQAPRGLAGETGRGMVESGLLLATGLVGQALMRQHRRFQSAAAARAARLAEQLRDLERELQDSQGLRDLGEQTARISHRLKNAIHPLRGFTLLLEEAVKAEGNGRIAIEGLQRTIDGIEGTIFAALARSVPANGREVVIGEDAVKGAVSGAMVAVAGNHPRVKATCSWAGESRPVRIPRPVLEEVLECLFLNAAEAMGGAGRIAVRGQYRADALEISVEDEGCGLPGRNRERLFEPGYTTKPRGSGLGLYLASGLLRRCGGSMTVSDGEIGARFVLRLPLVRS